MLCDDEKVEVVEIIDIQNPAKLFSPGDEKAYGVVAKQKFSKGDPVCCYGGTIEQYGPSETFNVYVFDIDAPREYKGPRLFINGEKSIDGKINDLYTPPGLPQRQANLVPVMYWDTPTQTPQIVFHAKKTILVGEELLYCYGKDYWKVMWLHLLRKLAYLP